MTIIFLCVLVTFYEYIHSDFCVYLYSTLSMLYTLFVKSGYKF